MVDRVRRFDWAATPLGPSAGWPASLRTAVDLCMASPVPAFVWWGPDLINIYNDAYAPLLGRQHPAALGVPAAAVWAAVWPSIADDVAAAFARGVPVVRERARFVMERDGFPDEMYFTYTLSPIRAEAGGVGGLFQVAIDETDRVIAERRLSDAKAAADGVVARFRAVLAGIEHGVVLADADGRVFDRNPAALALLGYTPAEADRADPGPAWADLDLAAADGRPLPPAESPVARLLRGEAFRDVLVRVRRPARSFDRAVLFNGRPIRDGDDRLALLTLRDAAGRRPPAQAEGHARDVAEAEAMFGALDLTAAEREFATAVAERLVDEAIDAYAESTRQGKGYGGSCIAAAVAVALMIVDGPS